MARERARTLASRALAGARQDIARRESVLRESVKTARQQIEEQRSALQKQRRALTSQEALRREKGAAAISRRRELLKVISLSEKSLKTQERQVESAKVRAQTQLSRAKKQLRKQQEVLAGEIKEKVAIQIQKGELEGGVKYEIKTYYNPFTGKQVGERQIRTDVPLSAQELPPVKLVTRPISVKPTPQQRFQQSIAAVSAITSKIKGAAAMQTDVYVKETIQAPPPRIPASAFQAPPSRDKPSSVITAPVETTPEAKAQIVTTEVTYPEKATGIFGEISKSVGEIGAGVSNAIGVATAKPTPSFGQENLFIRESEEVTREVGMFGLMQSFGLEEQVRKKVEKGEEELEKLSKELRKKVEKGELTVESANRILADARKKIQSDTELFIKKTQKEAESKLKKESKKIAKEIAIKRRPTEVKAAAFAEKTIPEVGITRAEAEKRLEAQAVELFKKGKSVSEVKQELKQSVTGLGTAVAIGAGVAAVKAKPIQVAKLAGVSAALGAGTTIIGGPAAGAAFAKVGLVTAGGIIAIDVARVAAQPATFGKFAKAGEIVGTELVPAFGGAFIGGKIAGKGVQFVKRAEVAAAEAPVVIAETKLGRVSEVRQLLIDRFGANVAGLNRTSVFRTYISKYRGRRFVFIETGAVKGTGFPIKTLKGTRQIIGGEFVRNKLVGRVFISTLEAQKGSTTSIIGRTLLERYGEKGVNLLGRPTQKPSELYRFDISGKIKTIKQPQTKVQKVGETVYIVQKGKAEALSQFSIQDLGRVFKGQKSVFEEVLTTGRAVRSKGLLRGAESFIMFQKGQKVSQFALGLGKKQPAYFTVKKVGFFGRTKGIPVKEREAFKLIVSTKLTGKEIAVAKPITVVAIKPSRAMKPFPKLGKAGRLLPDMAAVPKPSPKTGIFPKTVEQPIIAPVPIEAGGMISAVIKKSTMFSIKAPPTTTSTFIPASVLAAPKESVLAAETQREDTLLKPKQLEMQKARQTQVIRDRVEVAPRESIAQRTGLSTKIGQQIRLGQAQTQQLQQSSLTRAGIGPTRPTGFFAFGLPEKATPTLKKAILKVQKKAYDVYVKQVKGKKFKKIADDLPLGRALKKGAAYTKRTIASTFKVVLDPKATTTQKDINFTPDPRVFRNYKLVKGRQVPLPQGPNEWRYIERRRKRLVTRPERKEIVFFQKKSKRKRGFFGL